jgi:phosphoglycolate phosphatase-like HAD superfamily hydrolase
MTQLQIPADLQALIFDKDGTLIDFDAMWGAWITELARRLEAACAKLKIENVKLRNGPTQYPDHFSILNSQFSITERLFQVMGFDPASGRVAAGGRLAVTPMARLYAVTVDLVRDIGIPAAAAEQVVASAWYIPDPVALARPLADLPALFGALRARGIRIAVATSDDRTPTEMTLAGLGIADLVSAVIGADDGVPVKPAPDMVLTLCRDLGIAPARAAVVGDAVDDLEMGRAAAAGLVVGVLSGVSSAALLAPHADVVIPSVAELIG